MTCTYLYVTAANVAARVPVNIRSDLRKSLRDQGLQARVSRTTCQGYCKRACVVFTEGKKAKWWAEVEPADISKLSKKLAEKVLK